MGKFLNGILDNIRGKVGAVVGPVLRGAGNLSDALAPACTSPSAEQRALTWKNNSGSAKTKETDKAFVVVYRKAQMTGSICRILPREMLAPVPWMQLHSAASWSRRGWA